MINNVVIAGNLTRDPEVKTVGTDKTVAKFGLAMNHKFGGKEETTFVDVECWGKTAELVGEHLSKGRQVAVVGRLKQDNWEDKDGNKRSKLFVVASEVKFLGSKEAKRETTSVDDGVPDDDVPF